MRIRHHIGLIITNVPNVYIFLTPSEYIPHIKWLNANNIVEYITLTIFEEKVKSRIKPLQYNSSRKGLIIANNILKINNGIVTIGNILKKIGRVAHPTIIAKMSQPILLEGLLNHFFIDKMPVILYTNINDKIQYNKIPGKNTHTSIILFKKNTKM
jgi:hypothetical protein